MTGKPMSPGRYFLALWPSPEVRDAIARTAADWIGEAARRCRPVRADRYHLTVHFLGDLEPRSLARLEAGMNALQARQPQAFQLQLDRVGHFGAKAGWLGCEDPPAALLAFHEDLALTLRACGMAVPRVPSFIPHVTIARGMRGAWPMPPPVGSVRIPWDVREWMLVRSLPARGHAYRIMARRPLGAC